MTVREATHEDVAGIRRVARASWETDYPDILSRETATEGVEEWYAPERIEEELDAPRSLVLVAVEDTVVGFAHAVGSGDDTGHLLRLYVHPDDRGEGVGRRLFEHARDALFERGVDRVEAMVLADNDLGNAFYQDLGLEKVGEGETTIGSETHRENRYALDREAAEGT